MSGWYVEVLLLNKEYIKSRIDLNSDLEFYSGSPTIPLFSDSELLDTDDSLSYSHLEDDLYLDLLDVERTLKNLINKGVITKNELLALESFSDSFSFRESGRKNRRSRWTISKEFKSLCSKIAYALGEHFTDDGYIEYLKNKYNLTDIQINKIHEYLNSEYRLRGVILG